MKKQGSHNEPDEDTKEELAREKKISILQIITILVLLFLGVLLAVFSNDQAYIAVWLRSLFGR